MGDGRDGISVPMKKSCNISLALPRNYRSFYLLPIYGQIFEKPILIVSTNTSIPTNDGAMGCQGAAALPPPPPTKILNDTPLYQIIKQLIEQRFVRTQCCPYNLRKIPFVKVPNAFHFCSMTNAFLFCYAADGVSLKI